ncbi:MAG TPA: HDOD domain-containing protein [Myxococcota bacterium]|nr:HDOD domain-containing protein [Myxococcota bacterium]
MHLEERLRRTIGPARLAWADLPPPIELVRVRRTLGRTDLDVATVGRIVAGDRVLARRLVRIANSGFFGLPRRVSDPRHAVAFLGLDAVRRIASTLAILNAFPGNTSHGGRRLRRHAQTTTLVTRSFAARFEPLLDARELWAPAMLHELGSLVLLASAPDRWQQLNLHAERHGCTLDESERLLRLPRRRDLAALVAGRWGLDLDGLWHDTTGPTERATRRIVESASEVTMLAFRTLRQSSREYLQVRVCTRLGIPLEAFVALMAGVYRLGAEVEEHAFAG